MNTLLIGARGCGKTTIGRLLAQRLGCTFIDLDDLTLAQFQESSITEVWAVHGEIAWRDAECKALDVALRAHDHVISLGGGTPTIRAANQCIQNAQNRGDVKIVYIKCSAETLRRRLTQHPGDRPSLTGDDVAIEIATVLSQREPAYIALADFTIESDDLTPQQAVEYIATRIGR